MSHKGQLGSGGVTAGQQIEVSIIIPAYNEEKAVKEVVCNIADTLERSNHTFEIIAVDDGSIDGTGAQAEAAGARVLRHNRNRGYGAAIKTGIRHSRYPLICITDADGTYPVDRIPELLTRLVQDGCDMVVGARIGSDVAIPRIRRVGKWFIGQLANIVAGEKIPDINSGLRVFRRQVALNFFNVLPDGFSFTTTITLAMQCNGYVVDYFPINYYKRVGRSKIRPIRDTANFVQLTLRIALYFAPLKIFLPLSALLILLAVGWGVFSKVVLGELADVSSLVILMTGIQVAVIGLLAELIDRRFPNDYREN